MHRFSILLQCDLSAIHTTAIENIGIDYDIAGNVKGYLVVILLMAERMSQSGVQHFMHQHKFQFAITEVLHKFRVECNPVSIGICRLAG